MTFYQKVKKALEKYQPTTYARLADHMKADAEAVRFQLHQLRRRGKARASRGDVLFDHSWLWSLK